MIRIKAIIIIFLCLIILLIVTFLTPSNKLICVFKTCSSTAIPSPTSIVNPEKSVSKVMTEEFSKRYNKAIENVEVTVDLEQSGFAKGSIRFKGEGGGAIWFAAKVNDEWKLVSDGQGPMDCATAENYNMPKDLVPGCIDTHNNNAFMQR